MEFSPEYFEGEVRDGFYVQPLMKRVWAAQLEMLAMLDGICERHQIKYVAIWGTLLGAIRHGGYIPWDDDMDIAMLREDYERFLTCMKTELPPGWEFLDHNDESFGALLARVDNSVCIDLGEEFLGRYHGCPFIVGIDIFPLDHVPDDEREEAEFVSLLQTLGGVGYNLEEFRTSGELEPALKTLEKLTGHGIDREKPLRPQLFHLADRLSAMYWNEATENVAIVYELTEHPAYKIPRACFDRIIRVPFENTTIPVIEDYEQILQTFFGDDYMEPRMYADHMYPYILKQMPDLECFLGEHNLKLPERFHIFGRKNGKPLVSVVVSCCNAGEYIDRCLESLMCQTVSVSSLELICIDNASDDETLEKLKSWESRLRDFMILVSLDEQEDDAYVRNLGLEYANADYVTFVDAVDWVEMDYVERLYRPAETADFDVIAATCETDASSGLVYFTCRETGQGDRAFLIDSDEKRQAFIGLGSMGTDVFGKLIKKDFLKEHQIGFTGQPEGSKFFVAALYLYVNHLYLCEEKLYHRFQTGRMNRKGDGYGTDQ